MRGTEVFNKQGQTLKVGALVIFGRGEKRKLLILSSNGTDFTFPGGHLERGETPEQGIIREVLEETGLSGVILRKLPDFNYNKLTNNESVKKYMFLVEAEESKSRLENKGEILLWADWVESYKKITTKGEKSYVKYAFGDADE